MSAGALLITIQDAAACPSTPDEASLRAWLTAAADGRLEGEVTLRLVGEAESAALNSQYRAKAGPTNVLAFPGEGDAASITDEPMPAGDLVVCAPLLEVEAREADKALDAHWAHIVMHGTLHLLGYDHDTDAAAVIMEARERDLLANFGYPDPYS